MPALRNPYGQPGTYTDSQRVSAAKRRETVRNGCESARISCEIRYETSLNFAKDYANFAKFRRFCERVRKSAKQCMVRECETVYSQAYKIQLNFAKFA